jgi:ribosome-associated heat shock protein Hsp15
MMIDPLVIFNLMAKTDRQKILDAVRIDRWLWAARFYKSRTMAARACTGGKVDVNGQGAKPHKTVKVGDIIEFSLGDWRRRIEVVQLSDKRGPASVAKLLYEDHSPPPPEKDAWLYAPTPKRPKGMGRPTKRDRRRLRKLRGD